MSGIIGIRLRNLGALLLTSNRIVAMRRCLGLPAIVTRLPFSPSCSLLCTVIAALLCGYLDAGGEKRSAANDPITFIAADEMWTTTTQPSLRRVTLTERRDKIDKGAASKYEES